jgi:hypothetical protein
MSFQDTAAHLRQTKKLRLPRLQAGVRRPGDLGSFHPPLGERRSDLWWQAQVSDLTPSGLCVILTRHFGSGSILDVNLPSRADPSGKTFLLRVLEVRSGDSGGWSHRCAFVRPLTDDEMQGLQ